MEPATSWLEISIVSTDSSGRLVVYLVEQIHSLEIPKKSVDVVNFTLFWKPAHTYHPSLLIVTTIKHGFGRM